MLTRECFSGGGYDNSETCTLKCFFWYLRTELNGCVMISFVALDEYSSLIKYEAGLNKYNCTHSNNDNTFFIAHALITVSLFNQCICKHLSNLVVKCSVFVYSVTY